MEAYKKVMIGSTVIAILLTVLLVVYFFFLKEEEKVIPNPIPEETGIQSRLNKKTAVDRLDTVKPDDVAEEGEKINLNDSDPVIRELSQDFSAHPEFEGWLKVDNIIRRIVATVDNISNGLSPRVHIDFLEPPGKFDVHRKGDRVMINPQSYIRYQSVPMVLASLDTEQLVNLYKKLSPVFEEAYQELGYPGKRFRQPLAQALDMLINTPIPDGDILLEEKVTSFAFADPKLEELNNAQKHLIRMGSQNAQELQLKLKELRDALKAKGLLD